MPTKIKAYIVQQDILDEENYKFNKVYASIWNRIKKNLSHKYIFIEKNVKPYYKKYLKELSEDNYDILISGVHITKQRMDKVVFTIPIYISRPCILYPFMNIKVDDFYKYLKFYFRLWIKPFGLIILFCILICFMDLIIFKKTNLKTFLNTNSILLGNLGYLNFIKKNYTYIKYMIIAVIHLFLMHFIYAYTTAISVKFLNAYDSMNISIKNKKILLTEGSEQNYQLLKSSGAKPIIIPQKKIKEYGGIENYYLTNTKMADGVFISFLTKKGEISLETNQLKRSSYYFGSYYNAFAVNKKNNKFITDINKEIHRMKMDGDIKIECERNDVPSDVIIC